MLIDRNFEVAFEFEDYYILINRETYQVISWYEEDEIENVFYCLLIDPIKKDFEDYLSNKISLLELIKRSSSFLVERIENRIKIIEPIEDISKYKYMPMEDSFLRENLLNI